MGGIGVTEDTLLFICNKKLMPDLTPGTQIVNPTQPYGVADLEAAKFRWNNGTVTIGVSPTDRVASYTGTIVVGSGKSAGTLTSVLSGIVRNITQVTPNLTDTGTATTVLVDASGGTVIGLAAQNESVTTNYGTIQPISTDMNWITSTNGTGQASAMNVVLTVHYEK